MNKGSGTSHLVLNNSYNIGPKTMSYKLNMTIIFQWIIYLFNNLDGAKLSQNVLLIMICNQQAESL